MFLLFSYLYFRFLLLFLPFYFAFIFCTQRGLAKTTFFLFFYISFFVSDSLCTCAVFWLLNENHWKNEMDGIECMIDRNTKHNVNMYRIRSVVAATYTSTMECYEQAGAVNLGGRGPFPPIIFIKIIIFKLRSKCYAWVVYSSSNLNEFHLFKSIFL